MSKPKFNYILNDLAFINLQTRCLYTECTEQDIVEFENQLNLKEQELQRKDNIIKSLISYLETQINDYKEMGYNQSKIREKDLWMAGQYDEDIFILDKINELEGKNE